MKEDLRQLNDKLEEVKKLLTELYSKEDMTDKTLIDFFKPIMKDIMMDIANQVKFAVSARCKVVPITVISNQIVIDGSTLGEEIKNDILRMNVDYLLHKTQKDIDGKNSTLGPLWDEIERECRNGNRLFAVKRLKEVSGLGLREAKDQVDDFCTINNIRHNNF